MVHRQLMIHTLITKSRISLTDLLQPIIAKYFYHPFLTKLWPPLLPADTHIYHQQLHKKILYCGFSFVFLHRIVNYNAKNYANVFCCFHKTHPQQRSNQYLQLATFSFSFLFLPICSMLLNMTWRSDSLQTYKMCGVEVAEGLSWIAGRRIHSLIKLMGKFDSDTN